MVLTRLAHMSRRSRIWRIALILGFSALVAHVLIVALTWYDRRLLAISSNLLLTLESVVPVALSIASLRRVRRGDPRRASAVLLTVALIFNLLTHLAWINFVLVRGAPPTPSAADLFIVLFYIAFAASLLTHPAIAEHSYAKAKRVLELISVFLASGLLVWVFTIAPLVYSLALPHQFLHALGAVYPASAAAVVAALVFLLQARVPRESRTVLRLLWVAGVARLAADGLYSFLIVRGAYVDGGWTDIGFALSSLHFALAALWRLNYGPDRDAVAPVTPAAPDAAPFMQGSLLLPPLGLLLSFGLLIWSHAHPAAINFTIVAVVSGLVIALLTAREIVALKEVEALYRRQREMTGVLQRAHDQLERRVAERTADLAAANERMAREAESLRQAREALQTSLADKEALLQEVHHRVKNNLQVVSSLLALQARTTHDAGAAQALIESQSRLRAMGLIHQKLYDSGDLARLNFGDYLRGLVEHLAGVYNVRPEKVRVEVDVSARPVSLNAAVPCGLLVNEMLSNAFKHAFPGERQGTVWVKLADCEGSHLRLSVIDDGIGLPEDLDVGRSKSLGLKLIATLARHLDGELLVDRSAGTAYHITFNPTAL